MAGPFFKDAPCQNGVWTPPGVVSTAMSCDSFALLTKNGRKVDMWTSCSLLIIKRMSVHTVGCGLVGSGFARVYTNNISLQGKVEGALSLSTVECLEWYSY